MIGIIDYGVGNLHSVQKGLESVGLTARIMADPAQVPKADGVVLPGVGAFADAMQNLRSTGMEAAVLATVERGIPLMGICVGMQLLFDESEEDGLHKGLGLVAGRVVRFPAGRKVPHMGWNQLRKVGNSPLLKGIPDLSYFYFVHSYYCAPEQADVSIGFCDYGVDFACAIHKENIWGLQFHPEKSSAMGLRILSNFGEMLKH
jgi:glutamine amidotransferase